MTTLNEREGNECSVEEESLIMAGKVKQEPLDPVNDYYEDVKPSPTMIEYIKRESGVETNVYDEKFKGYVTNEGHTVNVKREPVEVKVEIDIEAPSMVTNIKQEPMVENSEDVFENSDTVMERGEGDVGHAVPFGEGDMYEPEIIIDYNKPSSSGIGKTGSVNPQNKQFECDICFEKFSVMLSLRIHKRVHSGNKVSYECNICQRTFTQSWHLDRHKYIHADEEVVEKPFECDTCMEKFVTVSQLNIHMWVHDVKSRKCNFCKKLFSCEAELNEHKRIHTSENYYECNICMKKYPRLSSLEIHQRIHIERKQYECDVCTKTYLRNSDLMRHKRIHGDTRVECDICKKKFRYITELRRHLMSIHNDAAPYQCNICKKKYLMSSGLKRHERTHETNPVMP